MIKFMLHFAMYTWGFCVVSVSARIRGRYTKSLPEFQLSIPHKLTTDGEFSTFHLPHFHDHRIQRYKERKKRSLDDPEMVHYGVSINDGLYHLELWPNREFLHPNLVIEKRDPEAAIKDRDVRNLRGRKLCHYTGRVRGFPKSKAAISTCDGLAGYIVIDNKKYFIEPADKHSPNSRGHHLHVVYNETPKGKALTCGTQESWEDAMRKRFREQMLEGYDIFKIKRGAESVNRYLEIAVICDKKFMRHHKERDIELYVMTVMNMVADYYHDSSVGHQMDIVLVRIIYLEKEEKEIDLEINRDAGKTLRSFCDWAIKINTPKDSPNHYDMAILLTRYDLCAKGEDDCDLTGLAYVGGVCSKNEQCGINEDAGLILSVIVAHEIGHLMGAEHDEQSTPCPVQDTDGSYFLMSPIVSTYTIRWSSCSRSMISTLLQNNLGECLNDVPESSLYPFTDKMPGVVYDASDQCKFMLPASLGVCSGIKEKICENLICRINKKECVGKNEVAADGTKCGENKWCFKKKCVEMGARPEAINGGWGDWGPWSDCTRSCGGGISHSERECNNPIPSNKGRFCLGERRQMKICNTAPCPDDSPNFRQQQCMEQDPKPWNGQYHKWTSSFQEKEPCALYCVNEESVLSQLEAVVKDGTPCKHGTKNLCLSGVCRVVGCDNVLDSEAVEDRCGVCNGDGTQCKLIEETFKDVGQGYTKVVVIPAGARKIAIEEIGASENIIAIADSSEKKFYLNGHDTEGLDGEYNIGKVTGLYTHLEPKKEQFLISGPLKEDVVLFLAFFEKSNPGLTYTWAEPSVDSTYEPHYHWEIGEFEDCSALCGGGTQVPTINCMEDKAGKVSSNFCSGMDKPKEEVKNCNEQPCKTKWKVGAWGQCRACKNKGGVRTRSVVCVREIAKRGMDAILIEDAECEGPKPGTVELCEAEDKCGRKRMASYIPGKYQNSIWAQMNRRFVKKRQETTSKVPETEKIEANTDIISTTSGDHSSHSIESAPGYTVNRKHGNNMVHDFRPLEEEVLVRYTIVESPLLKNLSDKSNAQMGDQIGDVIDLENKKVFTGKEAAKIKHDLEQPSNTTVVISCHKKETDHKTTEKETDE